MKASYGQNPILPPEWELYIADGEPHVFGDTMYIYGSRDMPFREDGTWKPAFCSDHYHVIHSRDLINWTDAGVSISVDDFPDHLKHVDGESVDLLWAPDLFQSPIDGRFYLTFCSTDDVGTYFIAESDHPTGPFQNVREITYAGKKIGNIDPGVVVDDDGTVYMAMPKPFRIGILDPADKYGSVVEGSIVDVAAAIDGDPDNYYGFEGPSLRKFGKYYYFIYIASPQGMNYPIRMNYLISEDIRCGWTFGGTIIDTSDYLNGINVHGSIEKFNSKYYLAYHRCVPGTSFEIRPGFTLALTRELSMEEIEIGSDGRIKQATVTSSGVRGAFGSDERIYAATASHFSESRNKGRFFHRPGQYAHAYFDEVGQFNGYRYVEFENSPGSLILCIKTESEGAILACKSAPVIRDGDEITNVHISLPNTKGEWQEVKAAITAPFNGKSEIKIELIRMPESGRVDFDWMFFK